MGLVQFIPAIVFLCYCASFVVRHWIRFDYSGAAPTTDKLTFRHIPMPGEVDWTLVRTRERDIYGKYFHQLNGTCNLDGWATTRARPDGSLTLNAMMPESAQKMTVEDIRNMSMAEYAKFRQQGMRELEELDRMDRLLCPGCGTYLFMTGDSAECRYCGIRKR